ncbi:MAG: flagellar protein FlaG [Kiritimatiellia bacterium]|jgi:flagellar protein FlaG
MSEVRPTHVTPVVPMVASAASSTRPEEAMPAPSSGKELPVQEAKSSPRSIPEALKQSEIEQAVIEINDYVQSVQRDLHFSVDQDSGLTVVRVRDKESGEIIRQIPEDIFLNLAQNLKDNQPIHLFDAHG